MENHQKNELWFSGLIGFFYQHGIGGHEINQDKALELYLLAVNIENEENVNHFNDDLKKHNIFVGKYLLALYYYKEIIEIKRNSFNWAIQLANNGNPFAQYQIGSVILTD